VLVGPGRFSYDTTDNYHAYQVGPQSHNVAKPDKKQVTNNGGSVAGTLIRAPAHMWTIKDTMFGIAHSRGITVNRDTATMTVSDTFPASSLWRQSWHLDPQWTHVSGGSNSTTLVFSHPTGRRLTITTAGRVSSVLRGVTRPPAGWHFPRQGSRVWAYEIVIRSYGRSSTTSFTIS
jgi:hypothetical protein